MEFLLELDPGILLFAVFGICIFIGVPIAMSLGIGALAAVVFGDLGVSPAVIAQRIFGGLQSTAIMAIAFFILAGNLMASGGISRRIVDFANCLIGNIRGGMSVALVLACAFFAALSGSAPATVVAIGSMLYADMVKNGYPEADIAGLLVVSGGLGPIIPPSIIMVLYCTLTGASVSNMFTEGMMIGVAIMIVLIVEVLFFAKRDNWPKIEVKRSAWEVLKIFLDAIPALLTPVIILGGIYSGLMTPTESAAIACVWAMIAGILIYREISIKDLVPIFMKSAKSSAMILFIIAASTAFSWIFTYSGSSEDLVNFIVSLNLNSTLFCLVIAIILLIFGTFMEGTAIAVLLVPVLWPMAKTMGIHPIHFGMIVCISNVIGTMTPPVAVNIFSAVQVTRSVRELKIGSIAKAEMPYFIGYTAVFFLCVFSEWFCTFLIK
ncbi:MAG: TRAP transporter large permease [Synergistaceae bacterium]|nr:TRAP transporter large permease [Synergistaceae bacterium]MBQ3694200.1 TRAP transporter large permease [Synergistaceae bacterium]MBQ9629017.1 TRAP transporter large permease [Synergistaceae bacterium]MBR0069582.1 TRAP transporter large permease [Synergistaceae bacterium]MBR0250750.1 TRAP transporter large permease [Synergistaceae bacterium]